MGLLLSLRYVFLWIIAVVILEQFPEEFVNMKTIMIVGTDVGKDRWYMVGKNSICSKHPRLYRATQHCTLACPNVP